MPESNPYESPEAAGQQLDSVSVATNAPSLSRILFLVSIPSQAAILMFAALLLDGGNVFRTCKVAAIAYWVGVLFVIVRRRRNPTPIDIVWIKYGFLLAIGCAEVIGTVLTVIGIHAS